MKKIWIFIGVSSILAVFMAAAFAAAAAGAAGVVDISTKQLKQQLDRDPKLLLIDVRTQAEITQIGTIKRGQNVNIPRGWLEFRIADYAKSKDSAIVVYCGQNLRSLAAAKTLMGMGYTNVKNYSTGYFGWKNANNPVLISDREPESILYRKPIMVAENVYSAIGATQPPTYQNSNHNNNLSFIVTTQGVLLFNAGGSYLLARALHNEIKKITDQPIKFVVLENAQSHAMLGSSYWQEQGAIIIAHPEALRIMKDNFEEIYQQALGIQRDKLIGVKKAVPDKTFTDKMTLKMGNTVIELLYLGASHSPDDIQLWLPAQKILISGDSAFNERLLPIFEHTDISAWIKTWEKLEALKPILIIPGHGHPTDLATVRKFTKDYLVYMHAQVEQILDDDGSLFDAYNIDQSAYRDWDTYRELHRKNAGRIFQRMEFN